MKIIDLLNKIANGERPEKIKLGDNYYTFDDKVRNYCINENCSIDWNYVALYCLNDEVEIIEKQVKIMDNISNEPLTKEQKETLVSGMFSMLSKDNNQFVSKEKYDKLQERIDKAIEYITSFESISTIQGLHKIEENKTLDGKTMNVIINRYLEVHDKILNILAGDE